MVHFQSVDVAEFKPCSSICFTFTILAEKRTPTSVLNAEFAHSLGRGGKIFVTSLNRQGLAMSYSELRRYQYDMAASTVNRNEEDMKLPAYFDPGIFTSAGMDNWDHKGAHSSEHDTVCILYQHKLKADLRKPKRADTHVVHGPKAMKEELPCQQLQEFVAVSLLYHYPTMKEAGLSELWMRAESGKTMRYIPVHILYERQRHDVCNVFPALHSLTGCDATSNNGTKKAALKAQPTKFLRNFGKEMTATPETQADAEKFLGLVLSETSQCSTCTELRAQMYHQAKASSHQNLPPTSEGLLPHIMRVWLSTYSIIHLFQPSILDSLQFGYYLQNDHMAPVTGCKNLKERWTVTCNCGKCARSACPCRMQEVGCTPF